MREIKFRANRYGVIGKVIEINFIQPEKGYDFLLEDKGGNQIREWGKNLDVMQCTGLTDKNGKEIYEGDIVKSDTYPDIGVSKVTYKHSCFCIYLGALAEFFDLYTDNIKKNYEIEVIGNIYENPELLENS